jgi:hypothetical protein
MLEGNNKEENIRGIEREEKSEEKINKIKEEQVERIEKEKPQGGGIEDRRAEPEEEEEI